MLLQISGRHAAPIHIKQLQPINRRRVFGQRASKAGPPGNQRLTPGQDLLARLRMDEIRPKARSVRAWCLLQNKTALGH
jgi:hypothetical protein